MLTMSLPTSTPSMRVTGSARQRAHAARADATPPPSTPKRVVVLGGAGRVGGSAAAALQKLVPGVSIVTAGRDPPSSAAATTAQFLRVDAGDAPGLVAALQGADLLIHTAGPFQAEGAGRGRGGVPAPLAAAIEAGVPYVDVCDDAAWARVSWCVWCGLEGRVRGSERRQANPPPPPPPPSTSSSPSQSALAADAAARAAGVPAITTAGVFPGLSGLLGAALVDSVRGGGGGGDASSHPASSLSRLRYSYFVAGTGGAGPAVLAATLLLAGTRAAAWSEGARVSARPWSQARSVDFGRGVGTRSVALIDLPEVEAAATCLGVPSVSARFGIAPAVFNLAMAVFAAAAPRAWVTDRETAARVGAALAPLIAAADALGADRTVAVRADLETTAGEAAAAIYVHRDMAAAVG